MPENSIKVKVLIVDDEEGACINLINLLIEFVEPGIHIVGIAHNTEDAWNLIKEHKPDAVFLDIEMPQENAFQFLERITPFNFEVIFITAYDEYALKAFRLNAIDYVLKPIGVNELRNAIKKLKEKIGYGRIIAQDMTSYAELSNLIKHKLKHKKIILKCLDATEVVNFCDIYFIEAQSSYSRILFLKNGITKEMVISNSLAGYEELLPAELFYRIHRSYLINCAHISKIYNDDSNRLVIKGEYTLPISRRRVAPLLTFLENNDFL